jgi:hypothetical protein
MWPRRYVPQWHASSWPAGGEPYLRRLTPDMSDPTPTNFWAEDGSWLVYTDCDRCATQVVGSAALIERIARDPEIETVASLTP